MFLKKGSNRTRTDIETVKNDILIQDPISIAFPGL